MSAPIREPITNHEKTIKMKKRPSGISFSFYGILLITLRIYKNDLFNKLFFIISMVFLSDWFTEDMANWRWCNLPIKLRNIFFTDNFILKTNILLTHAYYISRQYRQFNIHISIINCRYVLSFAAQTDTHRFKRASFWPRKQRFFFLFSGNFFDNISG